MFPDFVIGRDEAIQYLSYFEKSALVKSENLIYHNW